jgi:diguanylate cyclase (GGDEF)-like protein
MKPADMTQASPNGELKQQSAELLHATIMMVDDEPLMLEVLEVYLQEEGYRNFIAVDQSKQAIRILLREKPDVVFLDINMPEVDGFEILQTIRASRTTQHLPVIVLTSNTDAATKLKALELGATDFLEKPIDSSELALRLRNTLRAKAYQDKLAYYDGLTGLPNRTLFLERLNRAVTQARRTQSGLSVMNVSLDRFQNVNDSLGPLAGDRMLRQAAARLRQFVKSMTAAESQANSAEHAKTLARIGGDEFSILLPGLVESEQLGNISNQVLAMMRKVFVFENNEIFPTVSIGITRFPEDSSETESLVKHAGAANQLAKQEGRDNFQFYSAEISMRANERRSMEADLHRALERDELRLHYQPKVDAQSGDVIGMEGLIRWEHPKRGLVMPLQFIPLAEDSGLIISIGEWVINEACRQTRVWQNQGIDKLAVAVNVSACQFKQPGLSRIVKEACATNGLDPRYLVIELTEGLIMEDIEKTREVLHEIKKIGVSISIDDFGTGYSSLAYLKRFPIDELKIDRSFIADIPADVDDSAIIRAVVVMAESLELRVVAEGVETEQQLKFLSSLNCGSLQGNLFSPAVPADEFRAFVKLNRAGSSL